MQELAGYFFRMNYAGARVDCKKGNIFIGDARINGFCNEIQSMTFCDDDSRSFEFAKAHEFNELKKIQFHRISFTKKKIAFILPILEKAEAVELYKCSIDGEFGWFWNQLLAHQTVFSAFMTILATMFILSLAGITNGCCLNIRNWTILGCTLKAVVNTTRPSWIGSLGTIRTFGNSQLTLTISHGTWTGYTKQIFNWTILQSNWLISSQECTIAFIKSLQKTNFQNERKCTIFLITPFLINTVTNLLQLNLINVILTKVSHWMWKLIGIHWYWQASERCVLSTPMVNSMKWQDLW